jgi:hypothetical protein
MSETKAHSIEDIHSALAAADHRTLFTYQVPKDIAAMTGVKSVGMVELAPKDMIAAQRRGGEDKAAIMFELVKESWRRVNDKVITTGDGSADIEWCRTEPGWTKLRTLLSQAYAKIHNPKDSENADFLASETVSLGR